ncbi:hypothetical protein D5S17_05720 [Pseudonocardiaceae bacterium YIM PH 21723]|nr:hypothetical protein D5S17_05720 [Pseudonocardiaceae bacterium YIM PH 21723]
MTAGESDHGDLIGVWRLRSFHDLDEYGGRLVGPLGEDPDGLLFYSVERHVSVTMARTDGGRGEGPDYLSYAGTWRREGNLVFHHIRFAPDPDWVGTEQVRELTLDRDLLSLTGTGLRTPHPRVLVWQRMNP